MKACVNDFYELNKTKARLFILFRPLFAMNFCEIALSNILVNCVK